jgi:DNA-binding GntR family transcriptional regulator
LYRVGNRPVDKQSGDDTLSLVDRVHATIREAILSGEHPPTSRLLVAKIAQESGVSSIPVREALRRLEAERLVVLELNRGATVAPISVDDLRDVYETRIVMECPALRRALPKLTPERLDEAQQAVATMTRLLRAGRSREAYESHRAFLFALYEPAASPWSLHVIAQLWTGAERYLRLSASLRESPEEFAAEHEAVLEAVRGGDADLAVTRLAEHLRRTASLVERAYGAAEPAPAAAHGA